MTNVKKMTSVASDLGARLNRVWAPIRRVLTFSPADDVIAPQKNLSVSIDQGNISIAYGSRFLSRISIKGIKEYSFEEDRYPQPEDLLSSLSLAVNEFNASKSGITLSIPKAWTIIRIVEFPATIKENIPDVISYELDRLTPFTAEEAFFDFRVLEDKGDRISLLLMAAKTDQIRPYIDRLNESGFTVSRITVNLSAIGTLCRYRDKKSDTLFVEISNRGYEGALFIDGSIQSTFAGSFSTDEKIPPQPPFLKEGTGGLKNDEQAKIDIISAEIKPSMDTAKSQGKSPQVLTLFKDKNPALRELLKSRLGMPVGIIGETDIGLRLPAPHKEIPCAAVGSVMQSLWPEANGLNLLKKGRHEKQKTPFALTILLMLAIATIWIFYLIAPLRVEERKLQEISSQIEAKKEEARKVEAIKKEAESIGAEIAVINNFKNDRIITLNILKELTATLPKTAWISRARITSTSVDIEGYAGTATELLPKLEASRYFRKVEFASPIMRDARMNAERFNIKMEIEDTKDSAGEKIKNEKK